MARHLPPLNALRVFEAAARHRSFARAAEELHVTPAAISQQIKLLEAYLGVTLFKRGRILALSETSATVLPLVSAAFDQLEHATQKVRADHSTGPLVVSVTPAFASRWLIPRLDDFHARHPAIELHLHATRRLVNFSTEQVDAAIRLGAGDYPDLLAERVTSEIIIPVAAPGLAADIKTPSDLARCNLLEDDWHIKNRVFPDWETWLATLGVVNTPLRIRHFGDADLTLHAAVSGLGVALAWRSLVTDDLKAGRLVRLLDKSIPTTLGYHLVMPENHATLSKVAVFRAWLFEVAASQLPV